MKFLYCGVVGESRIKKWFGGGLTDEIDNLAVLKDYGIEIKDLV